MSWDSMRLARLSLPAKVLVTLFLGLVGLGYLVATANIYFQHKDADGNPTPGLDDLRKTFHGIEKQVVTGSTMLDQVRPSGDMYEYLELGGETEIRALTSWLEGGAKEEDFAKSGFVQADDPSAKAVISARCIECHHKDGGDMEDAPFAATAESEPEFALVADVAKPEYEDQRSGPQSVKKLVHVTHAHIFTIPVFALIVGALFLMTGLSPRVKLILAPLPMLAVIADIGSWWLARFFEPFIYLIAASGGVFGTAYGLQILCILASMWLGKTGDQSTFGK